MLKKKLERITHMVTWPLVKKSANWWKHVAMKHWEDGELKWDYQAVKKAFE